MSMSYEETMSQGAAQYADVTAALAARQLKAEFIQTGGMNAAITIQLEAAHYLLITDRDESLSWDREHHVGWYVGLYEDVDNPGQHPLRWEEVDDSGVEALLGAVEHVLKPPTGTD